MTPAPFSPPKAPHSQERRKICPEPAFPSLLCLAHPLQKLLQWTRGHCLVSGDPNVPSAVSPLGIRPSVMLVTTTAAAAPAPELPKCSEFPQKAFKAPDFPNLLHLESALQHTAVGGSLGALGAVQEVAVPQNTSVLRPASSDPTRRLFYKPTKPQAPSPWALLSFPGWRCVGSFWFSSPWLGERQSKARVHVQLQNLGCSSTAGTLLLLLLLFLWRWGGSSIAFNNYI